MKYQFPKSVTMSAIELRVNDVFSMAISCKMTSTELTKILVDRVFAPLNFRWANGRRKHSIYLSGYAQGLVDARRADIWRNHVEFCYLVDGVLYSTHAKSTKRKTEEFYSAGRGDVLAKAVGAHYWRDSDKIY